jgi:hypothetical protein
MILPSMPVGYWLLQESHYWYVLKDNGPSIKRLLDKDGQEKLFHYPEAAAEYAHKHNTAGLAYNQEVES